MREVHAYRGKFFCPPMPTFKNDCQSRQNANLFAVKL